MDRTWQFYAILVFCKKLDVLESDERQAEPWLLAQIG